MFADGRRVSGVPLNYSTTGHAYATSAHATAHKTHISTMKLTFPSGYMGLNAGGAEVPLSWNNIRWNTGNLLCSNNTIKKHLAAITGNYGVWMVVQTNGSPAANFSY